MEEEFSGDLAGLAHHHHHHRPPASRYVISSLPRSCCCCCCCCCRNVPLQYVSLLPFLSATRLFCVSIAISFTSSMYVCMYVCPYCLPLPFSLAVGSFNFFSKDFLLFRRPSIIFLFPPLSWHTNTFHCFFYYCFHNDTAPLTL